MNSFENLEERLHVPLFTASDFENSTTNFSNEQSGAYGILINIENSKNPILKLAYLFKSKLQLNKYEKFLYNSGFDSIILGVYPSIDKPLIIYPLHSNAEIYSNNNILPLIYKNKIKGFILSILMRLLKFNPTLGALILVSSKTNNNIFQILFNDQSFLSSPKNSFLSLFTTNNIYLIFNDSDHPDFALHEIDENDIEKQFDTKVKLFEILGDMVAEPLKVIKNHGNLYLVERGLRGKPWFQIATQSKNNWSQIKTQSLLALNHFQKSISTEKTWHREINLAGELKKQYLESCKYNQLDTPNIRKHYDYFFSQLANVNNVNSQFQHGDFCINNILHDQERTHLIDFEDFGKTSMPLHDNFSLALSFFHIQGSTNFKDLTNEINLCLSYSKLSPNFSKEVISALFFYHLMFRLGSWSNKETRSNYKKWILIILDIFLTNYSEFLSDLKFESSSHDQHSKEL